MALTLTSSAFGTGETIPFKYTCEGENISPIEWRSLLEATQSLILILDDPDASSGTEGPFAHWVIYNIPPGIDRLAEGFHPNDLPGWPGSTGRNSFGNTDYEGSCPPRGETHRYYFRLYALDTLLDLFRGATRAKVIDHVKGHLLENTELMASFIRP